MSLNQVIHKPHSLREGIVKAGEVLGFCKPDWITFQYLGEFLTKPLHPYSNILGSPAGAYEVPDFLERDIDIMSTYSYNPKSQARTLAVLLEKVTCELTETPDTNGGEPIRNVTDIKIG